MTKRKRGYSRWSEEEEDALRLGVKLYGEGKWKRILTDTDLAKYFVDRSNVDLKDKWRTMLCADKGTSRSAQALPETEGATSLEHSSGASPKDIPDTCDSAFTFKQVPKAPEHQTSNQTSTVIPPISSQSEKALKSALEAAKRRHKGTSGDRAQLELQLELLNEVLKAVKAHKSSRLLSSSELCALQGRLDLVGSSGRPGRTPARFFRDVLGLLQPPELSELRSFARRQFEVLCLVDDACRRSLLPALSASSASPSTSSNTHAAPKLSFPATQAQELKPTRASARQAAKHTHQGVSDLQLKQQQAVEDLRELLAVDALTMIREGSSSGDGSRGGGASHEAPEDEEICSPRALPASRPPPPLPSAPAAAPVAPPKSTAKAPPQQPPRSPHAPLPLLPPSPTVSVPEGCGLDSTCVSAAMDKASELLNQCSAQDLLPVRDLGIHQSGGSITSAATTIDYSHAIQHHVQPAQQQPQAQPMQSAPFALVPTSAFPILSPLALADKALPSVLKSGLLPAGAEAWYPAYMAWVYSGLVHSGVK